MGIGDFLAQGCSRSDAKPTTSSGDCGSLGRLDRSPSTTAVKVSTVLELMFAIVREVTITGQTSISSLCDRQAVETLASEPGDAM